MSSVTRVPQTASLSQQEPSADDAWATLRHVGLRRLAVDAFRRFRYGDGFTSSRALGFQFVLAFVPLVIATVGLSSTLPAGDLADVLRRTLLSLSPGTGGDAVEQALQGSANGAGGRIALIAGLLTALVALTTSMGQVERGANRIYGIQRDRPTAVKYARAALLALFAGIPAMLGFLLLVAGGAVQDAVRQVYGEEALSGAVPWLRWPVGVLLDLLAITVLYRWAPRRRQPGMSWLAVGAGVALALWLLFTAALTAYVSSSDSFGQVYGPLTGIIALLLWSMLTSVALLLGVAFSAQLEAVRAGVPAPLAVDPERVQGSGGQESVVILLPEGEQERARGGPRRVQPGRGAADFVQTRPGT